MRASMIHIHLLLCLILTSSIYLLWQFINSAPPYFIAYMLVYDIFSIHYTEMNYQVELLCIGSSDIFTIETFMMIITDVPPRLHCRPIIMNTSIV